MYVCNCSFLQPSDISTRSWWAGKGTGGGGLALTKHFFLTLHKWSIAGPGAWGSPSCSCWPFIKASLNRFASGKLYRVLVCRDIDGEGKGKPTVAIRESDSKRLGFSSGIFTDIHSRIPHPASIAADIGGELHVWDDYKMGG